MTDECWTGSKMTGHEIMARFPSLNGRVRMRWHSDYWDGPLSGYVEVDGEPGYWVECAVFEWDERPLEPDESCSECPQCPGEGQCCLKEWDRLYLVYKLSPQQDLIERANHTLFRKHVGVHTDYDEKGGLGGPDYNDENDANGDGSSIRLAPGVKPRKNHDLFYKAERPEPPPLREEQVVGYTLELFP